ncbi:MAG: carotenoid 1,2-hydratase [Anaerolineae bacterium]|nr:carotenoid 1,2-hydratase [Anaerolineae bacterium]
MRRWLMIVIGLALLAGLVAWTLRAAAPPQVQARLVGTEALQGPADAGFARVTEPRQFVFPRDHGPHPEYRTEWWYYTGNLDSADGEHLGFQLTFFRQAIAPEMGARASDWATRQVYMAHFAVTRASDDRFVSFERFSRGAAGLAGAQADPYRVWLESWEAAETTEDGGRKTEDAIRNTAVVRLKAAEGPASLDLQLRETKPIVLQGDRGLSQKSAQAGNASYYYSATRLQADGMVTLDGKTYQVNGLVWLDREFGTSALGPNAVGWDWFALQLADGRDIMFFQIRQRDGSIEPLSGGSLVAADGTVTRLAREDIEIQVLDRWTSPRTKAVYPARWRFQVPSQGISLDITPYAPDQELNVSYAYWEGAVKITGSAQGNGYIEMTGYAGQDRRNEGLGR